MATKLSVRRALVMSFAIGFVAWLTIWFNSSPRAGWDALMYHKIAFEYAGLSPAEQDNSAWIVFERYADKSEVTLVRQALDGRSWSGDFPASRYREEALYRMRPLYPAVVAAAYPLLGLRAPLVASALATIGLAMVTFVGLGLLAGYRVAALALPLALVNGLLTRWLIMLQTDGLGIALWAASITAAALYARTGRRGWLVGLGASTLALVFARPHGLLVPLVLAACLLAALARRAPVWRRFALATGVTVIPMSLGILWFALSGFPTLFDALQNLPTHHFTLPDIPNPIGWTLQTDLWAIRRYLLPTLLVQPLLLGALVAGVGGLVLTRAWWTAPFLAAIAICPVAWLIQPAYYDAGRVLAPIWVSLDAGMALLAVMALARWRRQALQVADWLTGSGTDAADRE